MMRSEVSMKNVFASAAATERNEMIERTPKGGRERERERWIEDKKVLRLNRW